MPVPHRIAFILLSVFLTACLPEEERERPAEYPEAVRMMHGEAFFEQGIRGKGVKVGILDIGFGGTHSDTTLSHLRRNGQIVIIRDLIPDHPVNIFKHNHGTRVLEYLAGVNPDDSVFGGSLARDAYFYLIRPAAGAGAGEDRREDELYIDTAFMILDSLGVRLVNMSIGFWDDFGTKEENYTPEQMDGNSAVISRICGKWAERGMIIVNSAGNTGEYAWRITWAPADVPGVISVGAGRFAGMVFKASFSGTGNPKVPFIKPDLLSFSPYGTSFSAPLITGMIACMLQKDSTLTLSRVMKILGQSASLYPYPNNYVGYGFPDAKKILVLMNNPDTSLSRVKAIRVWDDRVRILTNNRNIVVFDKYDSVHVRRQTIHRPDNGALVVKRNRNVNRTTVSVGLNEGWEIFWERP